MDKKIGKKDKYKDFLQVDNHTKSSDSSFPQKIIYYHNKLAQLSDSSFLLRYIFTLTITVIFVLIKYLFLPPFDTPYLLVLSGVIICTLYAGYVPGLISLAITAICVDYLFIAPQFHLKITHYIWIHTLIYIAQGVLVIYLIERERRTRIAIYNQARYLQVTLKSIGDAVITTDVLGKITFMNKVAENLTGWTVYEVTGKKLESVFNIINEKTKRKAHNPIEKAIEKNKIVGLDNHTLLINKNGKTIPVDDSAAPINDLQGNLIGAVLIFRDVTQRRELEQRKDDFVSVVSHELKTPVTSVKLFIQLLKRHTKNNNDLQTLSILEKVDSQIIKLAELVNHFLDLTRIQSGKINYKKEKVDLDILINDIVLDLQQIYHDYTINMDGKIGRKIIVDKERIKQVLINLITNAVKYSNNSKKINIMLKRDTAQAMVKVQDFGIGISKDQQTKIFDRFYQVNTKNGKLYPGLGLGLYISSQIVKAHQGRMWVDSEIGKGSTFQFLLPFKNTKTKLKR